MVRRVLGKKERNVNKNNDQLPTMFTKIVMMCSPSAARLSRVRIPTATCRLVFAWFGTDFYNQEKDLQRCEGGSQYFLLAEKDKSVV
jgi:hypothetical protein